LIKEFPVLPMLIPYSYRELTVGTFGFARPNGIVITIYILIFHARTYDVVVDQASSTRLLNINGWIEQTRAWKIWQSYSSFLLVLTD
jgi:hypothetical protein